MIIFLFAFIACISAVDIDPETVRVAYDSLQQSVIMSGNNQLSANLANSNNLEFNGLKEVWSSKGVSDKKLTEHILQSWTFREAINGKEMKEQEIIKYFALKDYEDAELQTETYQAMISYILRDLWNHEIPDQNRINNLELFLDTAKDLGKFSIGNDDVQKIFGFGKLDLLKYLVKSQKIEPFQTFKELPYKLAVRHGHLEMVKWLLEVSPSLPNYECYIIESIQYDQKRTFATILVTAESASLNYYVKVLNLALAYSFFHNRLNYGQYVLSKVAEIFQNTDTLSLFGEQFIRMYSSRQWNPTVKILDYFFSQKVWNPRTVRSIVFAMEKAPDNVLERIGMELLNPRFHFLDSIGYDPLQRAIEIVNPMYEGLFGKAKKILQKIKMSEQLSDHGSAPKRLKLGDEVEIFGMPFHPVDSDAVDIL